VSDLKIGSLFSGVGGLDLGVQAVIGGEVVWHVEFDAAPSKVLAHHWPDVPNFGDITKVDWSQVEPIDVLTGGFPCQDVSLAGSRAGLNDTTRSGLWAHYAHAISALKPKLVVIENVRGLLSAEAVGAMESDPWGVGDGQPRSVINALGAVLGDLAGLGYDAQWCGVRAADAGAPHSRFRVFIVASRNSTGFFKRHDSEPEGRGRGNTQVKVGDDGRVTENADSTVSGERWFSTSRQAEGGRSWANAGRRSGTPTANPGGDEPERWGGLDELAGTPETCESGEEEWERVRDAVSDSGSTTTANTPCIGREGDGPSGRASGFHSTEGDNGSFADTDNSGNALGAVPNEPKHSSAKCGCPASADTCCIRGNESDHSAGERGESANRASVAHEHSPRPGSTEWGAYEPAIRRWEQVLGRTSPPPTNPDGRNGQHRLAAEFVEHMMGLPAGHVTDPAIGLTRNQQLKALGNGVVPAQCSLALRMLGVAA
jgi:DNA (cytosine-5)-methyltransferase 1